MLPPALCLLGLPLSLDLLIVCWQDSYVTVYYSRNITTPYDAYVNGYATIDGANYTYSAAQIAEVESIQLYPGFQHNGSNMTDTHNDMHFPIYGQNVTSADSFKPVWYVSILCNNASTYTIETNDGESPTPSRPNPITSYHTE